MCFYTYLINKSGILTQTGFKQIIWRWFMVGEIGSWFDIQWLCHYATCHCFSGRVSKWRHEDIENFISYEGYSPTEDLTTHMRYKTNHFMGIQYIYIICDYLFIYIYICIGGLSRSEENDDKATWSLGTWYFVFDEIKWRGEALLRQWLRSFWVKAYGWQLTHLL